jgi:hypothetical protein
MFKGAHDLFALLLSFVGSDWQPKHVASDLFERTTKRRHALAQNLIELLDKYALRRKNISYVQDEGSNFNAMTNALKSIVSYEYLGLKESFQGSCF